MNLVLPALLYDYPHIINPVAFEMVAAPLGENPISTPLAHTPHALIDIPIGVNHPALSMGLIIKPEPIIAIPGLIEHGPPTLLPILLPVPCVFPPELILSVGNPERALSMPLILDPTSLILIAILVVLNAEALLFVVLPVADVFVAADPFGGFFRAVLVELLFLC